MGDRILYSQPIPVPKRSLAMQICRLLCNDFRIEANI